MDKKYTGKDGISIKLITNKIEKEIGKKHEGKKKSKVGLRKTYKSGTLKSDDMKKISIGLSLLFSLYDNGIYSQRDKFELGDIDISKTKAGIWNFRHVLDHCLLNAQRLSSKEYEYKRELEILESCSDIAQAARDGIILKKESRKEKIDGKEKDVFYDTSMTDSEVIRKIEEYEKMSYSIENNKLKNYIELGFAAAGILGTLSKTIKESKKEQKVEPRGLAIGLLPIVASAIPLMRSKENWRKEREKERLLKSKSFSFKRDSIFNEQISYSSKKDSIVTTSKARAEEKRWIGEREKEQITSGIFLQTAIAIITGIYISSKTKINKDGKIDGKTFAHALLSMQATKGTVDAIIKAISRMDDMKAENERYKQICEEIRDIISQMEEKVYPLESANKPFEKLEIKNFEGKFYPKKNYETDEVSYSTKISVPEFSMKKGETVLLSGESGTGKSTFLRLLKRGDINNQKCIKLDDSYQVDNLGNQYISFRPDIELGNETNLLFQITGKGSISELDQKEKDRLIKIMKELELDSGLNSNKLLEQMASKKFMEYSTGQQKRLALSKLFYRINDGTSAIIVDEPVGNVEDRLIRQQLEMIKSYAKKQDVMLLIVTHRLDAVKDMVDKRYNIDNNGLMKEIPVVKEMDER